MTSIPLNAHCFEEPHWRTRAGGFDDHHWFQRGEGVGTGGILNPQRMHLRVGDFYYRFANSLGGTDSQLGGMWWLDFESFRTVSDFAARHDYSLSESARLLLAIPHGFSRADLLVRARLKAPLDAYTGYGKPARAGGHLRDRDSLWIPALHVKVRQLCIPGLYARSHRVAHQLYALAFDVPVELARVR